MSRDRAIIVFAFVLLGVSGFTQNRAKDSLLRLLASCRSDTQRVLIYCNLVLQEEFDDRAAAIGYLDVSRGLANKLKYGKAQAAVEVNSGYLAEDTSNFSSAMLHQQQAIEFLDPVADQEMISGIKTNLANLYMKFGNYSKALAIYMELLRSDEKKGNLRNLQIDLDNIGMTYFKMNRLADALSYHQRALDIAKKQGDEKSVAHILSNIGSTYLRLKQYEQALPPYLQSLEIATRLQDEWFLSTLFGELGNFYSLTQDNEKALLYYKKALALSEKLNKRSAWSCDAGNIADQLTQTGKYEDAEKYLKKALQLSTELQIKDLQCDQHRFLFNLYQITGKHELALKHYRLHILYRDSLFNEDHVKQTVQAEMNHEFDKREQEKKLLQDKRDALALEEKKKMSLIRNAALGGLAMTLAIAGFIYRGYRRKQKANLIITEQKEMMERARDIIETQKKVLEEKQKELLDSIYYARRIQNALMNGEKNIQRALLRLRS